MLFYSYAELVVGLIAVFYFTSKIFVITKYKLYFILSLLVVIITASISMFIDEEQKNGVLLFLHFVALTFMPVALGYSKKMMLILSSLFFSGLTFFIFECRFSHKLKKLFALNEKIELIIFAYCCRNVSYK